MFANILSYLSYMYCIAVYCMKNKSIYTYNIFTRAVPNIQFEFIFG